MDLAFLFDIDGTLLKIQNKANRMVIQQILDQYGLREMDVRNIDFAGKTDRDIFTALLDNPGEELFERVKHTYLNELDRQLVPDDIHVFGGVHPALEFLNKYNARVGILTGNFSKAAHIKLELSGLDHYFEFGAFGDDSSDRNELPPAAHRKLQKFTGVPFQPSNMVIIGDTPRDIRCAQSFGAISIAVATGGYSADELSRFQPDMVLESLHTLPEWVEQFCNITPGRSVSD